MPKAMERALRREGRKRGYTGERLDAFVYGIMRRRGWRPEREKKRKKRKRKKR